MPPNTLPQLNWRPLKLRSSERILLYPEVIRDGSVGSNTAGDMAAYQTIGSVNEFNFIYAMKIRS